jgi:methyltransferase family protein
MPAEARWIMPTDFTLDAIGAKHGTDKSSIYHNYLEFYETFFDPLRNLPLTLLEIGVLQGASLKTWEEYFPKAKIVGVDIVPETRRHAGGRVSIELADQSNIEDLTRLSLKHGPFDIVIEDGSHMWEHQITSLRTLFPFVKNGGLYIVEDLQTNYGSLQSTFKGVASSTCVDFLKRWLDLRVGDDQLPLDEVEDAFLRTYGRAAQFITFYRHACLIRKQVPDKGLRGYIGRPLVVAEDDRSRVPVQIAAHLAHLGDVFGSSGFVNPSSERFALQGLALCTSEDILEYRVRWPDSSWSEWFSTNSFAGTRGQSKQLTGVTVRLHAAARHRYKLRVIARFAGSGDLVEASDDEDCVSTSGQALCGIQIELTERS